MIERLADYWSAKKPKHSKLWRWINFLLLLALIGYLVYALTQGGLRLDQIDWKAYGGTILAILAIYLPALIIQFYVWARIISFHRKVSWQDVDIYARMILMRSLPGGAWHWVGRISMYSDATEVPARVVVMGNFLEWALLILSGAGIFFLTLSPPALGFFLAALACCAALMLTASWQPASRGWRLRLLEGTLWLLLYGVVWLLAALILYSMAKAVTGAGHLTLFESVKAWTATGSLGMLVTMLPSSLGVREITLVWALQDKLTPSTALIIALMLRIVYTLADVIWGTIGWLMGYLILRYHPQRARE